MIIKIIRSLVRYPCRILTFWKLKQHHVILQGERLAAAAATSDTPGSSCVDTSHMRSCYSWSLCREISDMLSKAAVIREYQTPQT